MFQVSHGGEGGVIPTLAASVAVRRAPKKTAAFLKPWPRIGRFFGTNPPKNKTTKVPGCVLHCDLAALCAAPPSLPAPPGGSAAPEGAGREGKR